MNFLVHVALFGWIPVVLGLFAVLRRAVIVAFLFAWLFLPMAGYTIPGLPNYTKMSATCAGVLLAAVIFDTNRFLLFRPRWFDLPMLVWCLSPLVTSPVNGLGLYDGVAWSVTTITIWGLPYLIGRVYFTDLEGLRELAIGILIGGLVYVPLCLYEIRMSPQLHNIVYGYQQNPFIHNMRYGGYRPTVFMQSGLMVGMWMASTALVGVWLWATGSLKRLWSVPMIWLVPLLLVTTVLSKAIGAVMLLLMGIAALFTTRWTRLRIALIVLLAIPPVYMAVRSTGVWSGQNAVSIAEILVNERRASSLEFRMMNEGILAERAWERPLLGWGRFGRSRVTNYAGQDVVTTDGLWIITFGQRGLVGLISLSLVLLLPMILMVRRFPAAYWSSPTLALAAVLSLLPVLYMIDCLLNAMVNPIFMLVAGGVVVFASGRRLPAGGTIEQAVPVRRSATARNSRPPVGARIS